MKANYILLFLIIRNSEGVHNRHVDHIASKDIFKELAGTFGIADLDSITVISDNKTDTELFLSSVSAAVHRPITCTSILGDDLIPSLSSIIQNLLRTQSIKEMKRQLNLVVIGKSAFFKYVMKKAELLDVTVGLRSLLRHFSKWIWFPAHTRIIQLPNMNTFFDNVAVFRKESNNFSVIDTLLWTPDGREWCLTNTKEGNDVFPNIKRGLNGRRLRVAVLEFIPHSKRYITDEDIVYKGSSLEIMSQISKKLNFSIVYVEPVDKQWGRLSNGSWDGIVGMLHRGEADLCSVPYAMNVERNKVMTFTFPTAYMYHSAVYRKSEDESRHWTVLVSCFRWEAYLCGFLAIVVVVAVLMCSQRVIKEDQTLTVLDAIEVGFAIPLRQGLSRSSPLTSYKILLSFWWLFCIVMTSVYTGNLIALLTVSREHVPFRTLEEIGEQDAFLVSVLSGSYMEMLLKTTHSPELKKIWRKTLHISEPGSFVGNGEFDYHRRMLLQGHTVLLMDEPSIDVLMSNTCGLTKLPKRFMPVYAAMPFPKLSPLALLFANELMTLSERGMISTWYKDWTPQQKQCHSNQDKFQLQLEDLLSAFVGLAAGVCFSLIVLLCEYFLWKKYILI